MNCKEFLAKTPDERNDFVFDNKLCFCLSKRHYLNDCQSHFRCNEDNCKCKRYSLFHQELKSGDLAISNFNIDSERDNNKFLQIIPVIIQEGNNTVSTLALLDTM